SSHSATLLGSRLAFFVLVGSFIVRAPCLGYHDTRIDDRSPTATAHSTRPTDQKYSSGQLLGGLRARHRRVAAQRLATLANPSQASASPLRPSQCRSGRSPQRLSRGGSGHWATQLCAHLLRYFDEGTGCCGAVAVAMPRDCDDPRWHVSDRAK